MAFQFQCPNGHVLEGEPEQAGLSCQCPLCGVLFIIPAPLPTAAAPEPPSPEPAAPAAPPAETTPLPFTPEGTEAAPLLHIPCPQGHELEVPREMLNQFVECPHCQAQFHLRERDSVEYRKKYAADQQRKWDQRGQAWLQWTIILAVIVVLGLITLIALS